MAGEAPSDPHAFLEDVLGEEALSWVEARNAECLGKVGNPRDTELFTRILGILDSKDKIPMVARIGGADGYLYNFWQDEVHVQGIWRRTTLESYKTAAPDWHTVLDLDALAPPTTGTAKTWVWHGSTLLDEGPAVTTVDRALIALSPGGSDADTTREMDLVSEEFIDPAVGGFALPDAAKTNISYRSRDEVLVGTDFGADGSCLTDSGYPRVIRSWKRGTPLEEARTVFEAQQTDILASYSAYHDRGFVHEIQCRAITFYTSKYWHRFLSPEQLSTVSAADETTPFVEVPIQEDAEFSTFANAALVTLRSDWTPPGSESTYKAGSLLAAPLEEAKAGVWSSVSLLFEPTSTRSLQDTTPTKDFIVMKVLEDVRTVLVIWQYDVASKAWTRQASGDAGAVAVGEDVAVSSVSRTADADNELWLTRDGFLVPDTLELTDASSGCMVTERLKSKPAMFDANCLCVDQHFATSLDGTKVPYFVMRRSDLDFDGNRPTLLDAYGGFEISLTPSYSAGVGAGWLERGGVKVIANIRGGGEYGPTWHQAALKAKRHKAYEDLEAVAADLIERKITSPARLACIGGSNGGLLVGNMLTRPVASKLFGAAVCQVPLLDMKRYSHLLAGASWMAEYGDPDKPEEWAYLRGHSPYHLLRHDCLGMPEAEGGRTAGAPEWRCPKVLFTTSTRDDRVHPAHARKMVRALLEEASGDQIPQVLYWENTEGGHGGAADNKQRAFMWTLTYEFLAQTLGLKAT